MEVKKGLVYAVSLFVGVLVAGVAICVWASVPGVTSDGIAMPDPLRAVVDDSVENIWITGSTTISIRSCRSLNMRSSLPSCVSSACTPMNSSSVSTSDSTCAMPSPYTSPVVAEGMPEVSGASSSSASRISEVKSVTFK
uniref:Uncharacterized protein n=1 Tax=Solanum tuberosum TaxID=4113 RepID=M1DEI9_SOLTU